MFLCLVGEDGDHTFDPRLGAGLVGEGRAENVAHDSHGEDVGVTADEFSPSVGGDAAGGEVAGHDAAQAAVVGGIRVGDVTWVLRLRWVTGAGRGRGGGVAGQARVSEHGQDIIVAGEHPRLDTVGKTHPPDPSRLAQPGQDRMRIRQFRGCRRQRLGRVLGPDRDRARPHRLETPTSEA